MGGGGGNIFFQHTFKLRANNVGKRQLVICSARKAILDLSIFFKQHPVLLYPQLNARAQENHLDFYILRTEEIAVMCFSWFCRMTLSISSKTS